MKKKLVEIGIVLLGLTCATVLFCSLLEAGQIKANQVRNAKSAVVRLSLMGSNSCSATIISDRYAITAAHCIPPLAEMYGYLLSVGKPPIFVVGTKIAAAPVVNNERLDVALIEGDFASLNRGVEVDRFKGEVYEVKEALLCGYALFTDVLRCTKAKRIGNSFFSAKFDTVGIPGQSGGAVLSLDGKLIGVIQGVDEDGLTHVGSTTGVLSLAPLAQQP